MSLRSTYCNKARAGTEQEQDDVCDLVRFAQPAHRNNIDDTFELVSIRCVSEYASLGWAGAHTILSSAG